MPMGPPKSAPRMTTLPLRVFSAASVSFRRPRTPMYKSSHSAQHTSCSAELTMAPSAKASAVPMNGTMVRAMPRITVSRPQRHPLKSPYFIMSYPSV